MRYFNIYNHYIRRSIWTVQIRSVPIIRRSEQLATKSDTPLRHSLHGMASNNALLWRNLDSRLTERDYSETMTMDTSLSHDYPSPSELASPPRFSVSMIACQSFSHWFWGYNMHLQCWQVVSARDTCGMSKQNSKSISDFTTHLARWFRRCQLRRWPLPVLSFDIVDRVGPAECCSDVPVPHQRNKILYWNWATVSRW